MKRFDVPSRVERDLLESVDQDREKYANLIRDSTPDEVFEMYCQYNGLINWGTVLWNVARDLIQAEDREG